MLKTKIKSARQTAEEAQDARDVVEKLTVLAQPHRQGDRGDMTDALGMFVRLHECGRECYEAGNEYFRLVYRWRVASGVPVPLRLSEGESAGSGPRDGESLDDFEKRNDQENRERAARIKSCEDSMKCSGAPGLRAASFQAAQKLLLDGEFPEPSLVDAVKRSIHSLAIELGRFPF